MASFARSPVTAVLGPTNTGKTHLAIERLCAHASGMIGFPLRLLAREVYDRVVAIKGAERVALLTGEEKILPAGARWFLCTAESMPVRTGSDAPAFVALDEAQLAADPERGHVFTDRLLHARGREETMLLGSDSLAPLLRSLVPEAEVIGRPRFSTLSHVGPRKLSRLPRRSAIVAFSAEEVYAVAEMLRRFRGGASVVMGALSPRTRNAQVAMFQAGEVDYLVATDAIGMGLNMDVAHVAFASLTKFDGRQQRRLTVAEMAQIAGRAGRHQRDGTFGTLGGEDDAPRFTEDEVARIEGHSFRPLDALYWRDGDPPLDSLDGLLAALAAPPDRPGLKAAPEAVDLAVLRRLADDPAVRDRVRGRAQVARLWAACSLPDFQKLGPEHHARLVRRLWEHLSTASGHLPPDWVAGEIARLDRVEGDVATLAGRIAAARTWTYVTHRADWLAAPAEMAGRAVALEEKLSDALHAALVQRFVDRRTSVLLRDIGRDAALLPVEVDADGAVSVDGEAIGTLRGFRFTVDPQARRADRRLLLAAAERRLGRVLGDRARALVAATDTAFALDLTPGHPPALAWDGDTVATLAAGSALAPGLRLDKPLLALSADAQRAVRERLGAWLASQRARHLAPLSRIETEARAPATPPALRAILARLVDAGGVLPRGEVDEPLAALGREERARLRRLGVVIGVLDLFHPALLRPGAARWRMVLRALRSGRPVSAMPPAGATLMAAEGNEEGLAVAGFRRFADQWLRIDLAERVARAAHEAIARGAPFRIDAPSLVSLGLSAPAFAALMRQAGFRPVAPAGEDSPNWAFRGRPRPRPPHIPVPPGKGTAFAGLATLLGRDG
jgi:ATP-dependent RNA helicase SUPV3L1/SUV3